MCVAREDTNATPDSERIKRIIPMKNTALMIAAAVVAFAASGQADPITGTTGFTGSYTPVNTDLTTPNDIITLTSFQIGGIPSGSFVGGMVTAFTPSITLNGPGGAPTFTQPLWTITVGSHVYTFTSTADQTLLSTANINTIIGTGIVHDSLDGDTANGTYNLSFNVTQAGGAATFTFNGTSGSTAIPRTVPDGGTTVVLLGSALAGLGLIRRKLA